MTDQPLPPIEETNKAKPLLVYDGDCSFCRLWADYWRELTGDSIRYEPFQQAASRFPDIPRDTFSSAVQLLLPDGERRSGAHAAFSALAAVPGRRWLLPAYRRVPGFAPVSEAAYDFIARHRDFAYKATRFFWGTPVRQKQLLVSGLFLRALAIVYLIAFISFGVQAQGLIGEAGIVPLGDTLSSVRQYYGAAGYRLLPSLFWFHAGDAAIAMVWLAGVVLALLLFLGVWKRLACVGLFLLYLSLASAGQPFMNFQWDALLLEAGFLAIFMGWSRVVVWLFRWLLFRLVFMSGAVKLLSGDLTWRNLTALQFHYQTQPLPTPLAWYVQQLPAWFQQGSTAAVLAIELVAPWFIIFPRRLRFLAAVVLISLQVLILLTGNYTFFNLLTITLCLFLLDDARLGRILPRRWAGKMRGPSPLPGRLKRWTVGVMSAAVVLASLAVLLEAAGFRSETGSDLLAAVAPLEIVNSYGLFAVMTTSRPEIVIEGSNDNITWSEYEFKYKPGNIYQRPAWIAPHQPRLDWQMWFAALGNYRNNPWILEFEYRLLEGSPGVLRLLKQDPFPSAPPRYIRAQLYQYRFTTWSERRQTGAWWHRELLGAYLPPLSLADFRRIGRR
ncbi:MAG: lipase maturation factor family protein [Acidobacteriia bacterium]|nr:lipase maturation factor family protein [Terriglobia bacterium]